MALVRKIAPFRWRDFGLCVANKYPTNVQSLLLIARQKPDPGSPAEQLGWGGTVREGSSFGLGALAYARASASENDFFRASFSLLTYFRVLFDLVQLTLGGGSSPKQTSELYR